VNVCVFVCECECECVCVFVSSFQLLKKLIFPNLRMTVITMEFIQWQIFVNTVFCIIKNNMEDAQLCEVELIQVACASKP
jgi:hypothetical protein